MKTVVISGYYGYDNTGDEALLASMTSTLKKLAPGIRIIVLSAQPKKTSQQYGVEAVNRLNVTEIINALWKADLLLSGGGSLLQDVTGQLTIPYYLGIVMLAKLLGKKVMFYAQGIGPVNGRLGALLIKLIVNRVDYITLRDDASAQLLRELGVHKPTIEVTSDPVFAVNVQEKARNAIMPDELQELFNDNPVVGIFIREWKGITAYKSSVAKLADYLIENGRQVVFIPMQPPVDIAPAIEIMTMMEHEPVVVKKLYNFDEFISIISGMEMVVGMRLHALIIAAICATPMLGISYDPKVSDFLKTMEQPFTENLLNMEPDELIQMAQPILKDIDSIHERLNILRETQRDKAIENAKTVLKLL